MNRAVSALPYLLALGLALLAALLPPAATAAPPPLHTVEDYLQHSPDLILDAQQRQQLRDAGRESHAELPPSAQLRYGATYRFASPQLDMAVLLLVGRDEAAADALLRDFLAGDDSEAERRLGIRRSALAGTPAIAGARYEQLLGPAGDTLSGNRLVVRQKDKVYIVIISGLGGFDRADSADAFLRQHLAAVIAYDPAAPAQTPARTDTR